MFGSKKKVMNLTKENFSEVLKNKLVLIDFWADWCLPCKMQAPILEQVAGELGGRVTIAKMDVDKNQNLASKYGIKSIPTLLLFRRGSVVKQFVGVQQKQTLINAIDRLFI